MRVLASFGVKPSSASNCRSRASAAWACCRDLHTTSRSSAKRTSTPNARVSQARSSRCRYTLHIRGLLTPPTQLAIRRYFALRVGFGAVVDPAARVVPHRDAVADGDLVGADEHVFDEQAQDALAFGDGRCGGLAAQPGEEVFEVVGELEVDLPV